MNNKLLVAIVHIAEILKDSYNLSLEESVECINDYVDIIFLNRSDEDIERFINVDSRLWAKKMYDNYIENKINDVLITEPIEREDKINLILSNDEYINWLDSFTKDKEKFNDIDWIYNSESISEEDLLNVDKLHLLFDGICDYSNGEGQYEISPNHEVYYSVKYNDFMFKIGVSIEQSGYCFCERIKEDDGIIFIDFDDIMNIVKEENEKKKILE